ncbi:exosome complex component RRP42 [Cimex lectularius]|uniref:Ribosomal RNA-processing protein 42 n=1 Tax=Cimex lectularius TaxID=79782 RepID=A0A8I6SF67_CIMLE|nr:exosome complex component RRP42 [Cimex lectularius]
MVLLSPEEKIYIVHGIEANMRVDGREQLQFRPIEVETGLMPNCMGSARVLLGKTDLIACISVDTITPLVERPDEGKLEFYIHFSGITSPEFEGRKGEQKSDQISTIFNKLYSSVRLNSLCIEPRLKSWKLNIDVCVLSLDGNLYDAVSFATKAALSSTNIPNMIVTNEDKGEKEFKISEDPSDTWVPDISDIPCFITVSKVGESFIVDATSNEEQCTTFSCVVAVTESGLIQATLKVGPGSLQPGTFLTALNQAVETGLIMNKELKSILAKESEIAYRETVGFLN